MAISSNFILKNIIIDDYKVLESGTIICHKQSLIFDFQNLCIKIIFLKDRSKSKNGSYELISGLPIPELRCYNFNNQYGAITAEPFEVAVWQDNKLLLSCPPQLRKEKLYISFDVKKSGDGRIINYTFFTKEFLEYV
jgi:hypothetical protein